jgi:hypothetical protein
VYSTGDIFPKASGQTFDGSAGAVLDGGGTFEYAFANRNLVSDITIRGFDIRNYANVRDRPEQGAVGAWGTGWIVEDNHIHDNGASGVSVGMGTIVRDNLIDHNACAGVDSGYPAVNDTVQGNEISFNNYQRSFSPGWSCGGGKFARSLGLTFVGNDSHDNTGWGFWLDGHNGNATIQGNRFANNAWGGLKLEINDAAHAGPHYDVAGWGIKVIGNSFSDDGWANPRKLMYGTAMEVAATNHVEIADNSIAASSPHALTLTYTARHDFSGEDLTVHDISVHDNDIGLREDGDDPASDVGRVGFFTADSPAAYRPTAISFENNHYYFDSASAPHFSLPGPGLPYDPVSWTGWQAAGYDPTGSVAIATSFPRGVPSAPEASVATRAT